jgi:DNA-binding Xre family transcriptional regulator
MTKLRRDEAVNLAILGRICDVLDCDFGDIMEYIKEPAENSALPASHE